MFNFRKSVAFVLTTVVAASTLLSASAASTTKNLSSNFTLVNLVAGTNNGQISYVKPDGSEWRASENFTLDVLGEQTIRRQYDDGLLSAGSGSVVVSTDGPVGAVVQIQARTPQIPTFGAYVGVGEGAAEAGVPLVQRQRNTASGLVNSQIIAQNASSSQINIEIVLINGADGSQTFVKTFNNVMPNAAVEYDLADEDPANVPAEWFGSATVRSTTAGGEVAVVSNLFSGEHGMQTFNAFTSFKRLWGVPLFASKLANDLNTPVAVQNVSGSTIPPNTVTLSCVKDDASVHPDGVTVLPPTLSFQNGTAIADNAAFFFNPVTDAAIPAFWFGACTVNTGTFDTAVFVQLRTVREENGHRAAAHEGIPLDSTSLTTVIPLYAKTLVVPGGQVFASAVTILNLSSSAAANVSLAYLDGLGTRADCNANFTRTIAPGGSLIQNHRLPTTGDPDHPNSVPQLAENCFGTLTVTSSDQPIHAFVQLDLTDELSDPDPGGDPFQAHNAFTISAAASN